MLRTHTCGELTIDNVGNEVTLCGWVQRIRDLGAMSFIDLRDRYGITQLLIGEESELKDILKTHHIGRESVLQVKGRVLERLSKNKNIATGEIEIEALALNVLNQSDLPPFTIEDETDGGEELRMKYRYLDLRRSPVRDNIILRHRVGIEIRNYLDRLNFIEVETPVLIKSTPEGARDFIVPSRMNKGGFYALPQSPQVFKQLLMVGGFDRYYQIVKCFRDEDLRADRQPEFTQVDCEMSFVEQEDVLNTFEGMMRHIFNKVLQVNLEDKFPRMPYSEVIRLYGSDKPDIRFGMTFVELKDLVADTEFPVFKQAEYVAGIAAPSATSYSRKELDDLVNFVKTPQVGASGLVYVKCNADGTYKSTVDKFYTQADLKKWAERFGASPGDLLLILAGDKEKTQQALGALRLEMGERLGLKPKGTFKPLWVVDFPLLEWDEEHKRFHAMHHPFTSPKPEDMFLLGKDPKSIRANAYDLVINGVEIGGGSVRIFDEELQQKMFQLLGFTEEEAESQFGFLMNAFRYGAPPHAGIAFGFDRLVSLLAGLDSIRDCIAFPKNNSGRDVMIDSPSKVAHDQLTELGLELKKDQQES